MPYRAIFGVQAHAGDQILVARLNGIPESFSVALERSVQRRVCTQLSSAAGLLSAFAGTMPALTAKYPMPTSTTSVKIMPPRKLTIDFIALDVPRLTGHRVGPTLENDKWPMTNSKRHEALGKI